VTALRDYQEECLGALAQDWSAGLLRLGVGLPTGTGKTHIMAALAVRSAGMNRPGAVLVLVHRDTLVEQTERKMREHAGPGVTVGVVKAARNVVGASIIVASVHTLRNAARLAQIPTPVLIICDEAHVTMSATYAKIFVRFSTVRTAGFSATWVRSDSKRLGDFWQKISYQKGIRWAIREGHLVYPRGIEVGAPEDVKTGMASLTPRRGGDYRAEEAEAVVTVEEVRQNVVRGYLEHARDRSAVLFAPTKASAEFFRRGLVEAGIPSEGIYDTTGPRDRRRIFADYQARRVMVLTSCTALAEGWDAPWCSAALMCAPTRHAGLYIQRVGRVLRPWPGKRDALVLDFVGAAEGMSLSLDAVLTETEPDDPADVDEIEERDQLPPGEQDDEGYVVGLGTRPVELFAGTEAQWLTTDLGVPFIATRTHLYFLVEVDTADGPMWNVGMCYRDRLKGGRWLLENAEASDALQYASVVAIDDDPMTARSGVGWRNEGKPSAAQLRLARSIGLPLAAGDGRSAVSDKINIRQASITLRPIGESRS